MIGSDRITKSSETRRLSLLSAKHEEHPIKNEGARVDNIINHFFRRSSADNSGVGGGIWPKFELILSFVHFLVF